MPGARRLPSHLDPPGDGDDDQEGEELSSLSSLLSQHVEGFPTDCLPDGVRRYVEACGWATGAPSGFVALPLLVFAGAAIGNNQALAVKGGEWYRPSLFGAILAPPGRIKSPAINAARRPLDVLQAQAAERYEAARDDFEERLRAWESLPRKDQATVNRPVKPTYSRYYTVDTTIEAVAVSVRDNPGIAIAPDELTAWIHGMDAYRNGRGGDRQNYLRLWSGQPLDVNHKGQEPLFVPNPVVGIVGGIQPSVIKDLAKGERYDGLVDRILWEASPSRFRRWTDVTVPAELEDAMVGLFRQLRSNRSDRPVTLSDAARRRFRRWIDENADVCEKAEGLLAGVYAKLDQQIAKICLVLHCMTHPSSAEDTPVSDATMAFAIEIGEYYRCQANVVVQAFGCKVGSGAAGLQDRIYDFLRARRDEEDGWVTRTSIRSNLGRHIEGSAITTALIRLENRDAVETRVVKGKGRPSEEWRVTRERDGTPVGQKGQKGQKPPSPPGSAPDAAAGPKGDQSGTKASTPPDAATVSPWRCPASGCGALERAPRPSDGVIVCDGCGAVAASRHEEVTA